MTLQEAKKIIKQLNPDEFNMEIEDSMFGDGSRLINFVTLWDSEREANEVAQAIKTILRSIHGKI